MDCGRIKMLFATEKEAANFMKFNNNEIEEESGHGIMIKRLFDYMNKTVNFI